MSSVDWNLPKFSNMILAASWDGTVSTVRYRATKGFIPKICSFILFSFQQILCVFFSVWYNFTLASYKNGGFRTNRVPSPMVTPFPKYVRVCFQWWYNAALGLKCEQFETSDILECIGHWINLLWLGEIFSKSCCDWWSWCAWLKIFYFFLLVSVE